jgi:hypothetical protein
MQWDNPFTAALIIKVYHPSPGFRRGRVLLLK